VSEPGWLQWEHHVQDVLGLSSTPASGARWHDVGDAVDNDRDSVFPLLADAKYTDSKLSYSIGHKFWTQWQQRAAEAGKRFILPIRIHPHGKGVPADVVAIGLDDFAELLELARRGVGAPSGDDILRIALGERE